MISLLKRKTKTTQIPNNNKPWIRGRGSQKKCFERSDLSGDQFFISRQEKYEYQGSQIKTYSFNSFKDIDTFLRYQAGEQTKTFNEIIRVGTPCIEYYDIDAKWSNWSSVHDLVISFLKLREEFGSSKLNIVNPKDVRYDDLIITEACNDTKLSLHIIIRQDYYFKCTQDLRVFAGAFSDWIQRSYPKSKISIDMSVYNNNSAMRCIESCKLDDLQRPFKPYGLAKKIKDKRLFFCSYIEKFHGVVGETSPMYLAADVTRPRQNPEKPIEYPKLQRHQELHTCRCIIKELHPKRSVEYNDWFAVGSALYNTLDGSEEGLNLFLLFSAKCEDKYNEIECRNIWTRMKGSGYTKGTLVHMFNEDKIKIPKFLRK